MLSAVPWKKIPAVSLASTKTPSRIPPEIDENARTLEEKPGLPLVPGSSARRPASVAVMPPADSPPIAIRPESIPYWRRSRAAIGWLPARRAAR